MRLRGRFCEKIVAPKSAFDRRSFRWVKSGRGRVLVGCPIGKWKRERCSVGMKAHAVLTRGTCSVGQRVVRKGRDNLGAVTTDLTPEFIEVNTDYLTTATDLRTLVVGKKANRILGIGGEWTGKVVGTDPETGSQVTVAWYSMPYEMTADAKKRASQLMKYVRGRRSGLGGPRKAKPTAYNYDGGSYRGYGLRKTFTDQWIITKDGFKISIQPTLEAAKAAIDSVVG